MEAGLRLRLRKEANNINVSSEAGRGLPPGFSLSYPMVKFKNALAPALYVAWVLGARACCRMKFVCPLRAVRWGDG